MFSCILRYEYDLKINMCAHYTYWVCRPHFRFFPRLYLRQSLEKKNKKKKTLDDIHRTHRADIGEVLFTFPFFCSFFNKTFSGFFSVVITICRNDLILLRLRLNLNAVLFFIYMFLAECMCVCVYGWQFWATFTWSLASSDFTKNKLR